MIAYMHRGSACQAAQRQCSTPAVIGCYCSAQCGCVTHPRPSTQTWQRLREPKSAHSMLPSRRFLRLATMQVESMDICVVHRPLKLLTARQTAPAPHLRAQSNTFRPFCSAWCSCVTGLWGSPQWAPCLSCPMHLQSGKLHQVCRSTAG